MSILPIIVSLILLSQVAVNAKTANANWYSPNGSIGTNQNYLRQSDITSSNVQNLQVKWIFPVPAAPKLYTGAEGVMTTPSLVSGIAYFITNYNLLVATDARDGHVIWSKNLPVMTFAGKNITFAHYHAIWFSTQIRNAPLVWVNSGNYTVFAFNALNGDQVVRFAAFDPNKVPGNFGIYGTFGRNMVIDDKRGIIVVGSEGSEGTDSARGFIEGIDVNANPPKVLWRSFIMPPQDGSDPNWSVKSVQNLTSAWIWNAVAKSAVDLKGLSSTQLQTMLGGDWGNFGFNGTRSYAGAGMGWGGSWAVDESTGLAYVATAQVGPDFNASLRPGPNLWSASVLSVDINTGKLVWAFQSEPHDLWDFDCSWNVVLANATINGALHKTVIKGCKNGWLYALDAATGKPFWGFYSPSIKSGQNGFNAKYTFPMDPTNKALMTLPWPTYPATTGKLLFDATGTGNIESDTSYDPDANIIISVSYNIPTQAEIGPVKGPGVPYGSIGIKGSFGGFSKCANCDDNATVSAINANTGQPIWQSLIKGVPFRGGTIISGGVVYVPSIDGFLRLYDEKTGTLIASKLVGGPMIISPAIGTDANGDMTVIVPMSSSSGIFPANLAAFPGAVIAFGLGSVATVTSTAVSTSVQTSVQTSVSTSVQTLSGPPTGIDPSTFYAAVGVAVIFVIATGVLAMRRRGKAPAP